MTKFTRFADIPQMTRSGSWECDFALDRVVRWVAEQQRDMNLDINPDFQREHVWTETQQRKWLQFFLCGGKTGRVLYFNCPSWHVTAKTPYNDFVIVDGKQRLQAITKFIAGEIKVFDSYIHEFTDNARIHNSMKINVNDLPTRGDVLRWYLEMNEGGTPHTEHELYRVRALLHRERNRANAHND